MSTIESTDVKLESGENGSGNLPKEASKQDKPRGIERTSTLARLQSQSTMSKGNMKAALKSGGKENFRTFCSALATLACVTALLVTPGAVMLSIYYGNDGPNAPCSTDVPHWFLVTGCASISMAGVPLLVLLVVALSSVMGEGAGACLFGTFSYVMSCAFCVLSCFMFGLHDRSVPRLRALC